MRIRRIYSLSYLVSKFNRLLATPSAILSGIPLGLAGHLDLYRAFCPITLRYDIISCLFSFYPALSPALAAWGPKHIQYLSQHGCDRLEKVIIFLLCPHRDSYGAKTPRLLPTEPQKHSFLRRQRLINSHGDSIIRNPRLPPRNCSRAACAKSLH